MLRKVVGVGRKPGRGVCVGEAGERFGVWADLRLWPLPTEKQSGVLCGRLTYWSVPSKEYEWERGFAPKLRYYNTVRGLHVHGWIRPLHGRILRAFLEQNVIRAMSNLGVGCSYLVWCNVVAS